MDKCKIENKYSILENMLNKYFIQISKDIEGEIGFKEATTTVLVIADAYKLLPNKEEADELIFKNMNVIKKCILENTIYSNPAIYDGLADAALSVYAVYKSTGNYKKFLDKVNELLLEWTKGFLKYIDMKENLRMEYYDLILGVSGVAKYFLLVNENGKYDEILKELIKPLMCISGYNVKEEHSIPKWHIKSENLIMQRDRDAYPTGYLNFGLAHGIAGPLVILSESYKKGIIVDGLLEAINNIINEYKKLVYKIDGKTYWTGLLCPEYYLGDGVINDKRPSREGWCYGAIGIAKALFIAGNCIGDKDVSEWAYKILKEKAQFRIDEYMLESHTLCHGYAGVLSILTSTNNIYPSIEFKAGIHRIEEILIKSFDKTSKYGFKNIDGRLINGQIEIIEEDKNTLIDGAAGVLLALLSSNGYVKNMFMNKLLI